MNNVQVLSSPSISDGWRQFAQALLARGDNGSYVVQIARDEMECVSNLAKIHDSYLINAGRPSISETAQTIFPFELWKSCSGIGCKAFCEYCISKLLPRIHERSKMRSKRHLGTYFQRMMESLDSHAGKSQLETIIEEMSKPSKRPRESMLQLAIYDPKRDLICSPQLGFPCLQQIALTYPSSERRFVLNAMYPSQHVFDRAHGNYKGLQGLGHFIAHYSGWKFEGIAVFALSAKMGSAKKETIRRILAETPLTE